MAQPLHRFTFSSKMSLSNMAAYVTEMVKTIVLRQDPPFRKKTGGLSMYPPPPTLKDGVLFV